MCVCVCGGGGGGAVGGGGGERVAIEPNRDSEVLKSFRLDIQDSHHSGHLEKLQTIYAPEWYVEFSRNLLGGLGRHGNSKLVAILKIFKSHLFQNWKSDRAESWLEILGWHGDSELLKSFSSDIQSGCHAAILKFFKPHLPNRKWNRDENWW